MKPGIYRNFNVAEYHADPCPEPSLNQSTAKVILEQSPMHAAAEHPRLRGSVAEICENIVETGDATYNKAQAIGDAAHKLMIQRGKDLAIGDFDDWRTKESKEFKAKAIGDGLTPILTKHFEQAGAIVGEAHRQLALHAESSCFLNGSGEVALIWREDDGLWFRCLVDWLADDLTGADDYKTTAQSVAPQNLGILASTAGWHIQAAMIERGLNALDYENIGRRRFRFVAQEQNHPHGLNVFLMNEYWLTMGRKQLEYAIRVWRACMAEGRWPGYPTVGITPDFPGFRESQWLKRELEIEEADLRGGKMLTSLAAG